MVGFILSQKIGNMLEEFCRYEAIWLLINHNDKEYMVNFYAPVNEYGKNIKWFFAYNQTEDDYEINRIREDEISENLRDRFIDVWEIRRNEKEQLIAERQKKAEKLESLDMFFDTTYSMHELINQCESYRIKDMVKQLLNTNIEKPKSKPRSIKRAIERAKDEKRIMTEKVKGPVETFNKQYKNMFKIEYRWDDKLAQPFHFKAALPVKSDYYIAGGKKYNIKNQAVKQFLDDYISEKNFVIFAEQLENGKLKIELMKRKMLDYAEPFSKRHIDKGILELTTDNVRFVINDLVNRIKAEEKKTITNYLADYYDSIEKVELYFNVNNKEDTEKHKAALFKDVAKLSLGQKVVAMLSFILAYSDYSGDYRPLILDQPEDSLDNRYIYKTLVYTLRRVKKKRQVIIATHNATIVTNAKAEQVIVLDSDGKHGHIKCMGYPNEDRIKKNIINNLEGGSESFKHKMFIYNPVL